MQHGTYCKLSAVMLKSVKMVKSVEAKGLNEQVPQFNILKKKKKKADISSCL